MVELERELATIGAFLRPVRYGFINRLVMDKKDCIGGIDGDNFHSSQGMVRKLFALRIFRILLHIHFNRILDLIEIPCLAETAFLRQALNGSH